MTPAYLAKFEQWYVQEEQAKPNLNFQQELIRYCIDNVRGLVDGGEHFRQIFKDLTDTEPYDNTC